MAGRNRVIYVMGSTSFSHDVGKNENKDYKIGTDAADDAKT